MKFRKKPVVVDAVQWDGHNADEISKFLDTPAIVINKKIRLKTLEGTMYADVKDWVIKGVQGEFYPCKPDIFEKTYEPTEQK